MKLRTNASDTVTLERKEKHVVLKADDTDNQTELYLTVTEALVLGHQLLALSGHMFDPAKCRVHVAAEDDRARCSDVGFTAGPTDYVSCVVCKRPT